MAPKKAKPTTDPKYTLDVSKDELAELKKKEAREPSPGEHLIYLAAQQLNHSAFSGITEEIARVQGEAFTKEFEDKASNLPLDNQFKLTPQQQLAFIQCSTTPPEKLAGLFQHKFTGIDKDGNNTPLLVTADEIQQVRDIAAGRTKDRGQLVENALDNLTREKGKLERAPARGLMPSASLTNDGMEEAAKKFRHNLDKMRDTQKMELNPAQQKMILLHGGMSPKELARASGHFSNHDFPKTEVDARKQLSELRGAEGVRAMVYASGMRVTEEFSSKLYAKLSDPNLEVPKEAKPAFDALKTMATATSPEDMKKGWEAFQKCPQEVKMAWKAVANTTAEGMLKETRQEQAARDQACVDYFKTAGVDLSHERSREVYQRLAKEGDEPAKSMLANINKMARGDALTDQEKQNPKQDGIKKVGEVLNASISKAKDAVQKFPNCKVADPGVAEGVYARICRDAANGVPNAQIWKDAFDNDDFRKFSEEAMKQMGVKMQSLQAGVKQEQSIPRLQQVAAKQGVEMDDATARVIDAKVTRDYNSGVLDKGAIQEKFKDTAAIDSEAKRAKATIEAVQNMAEKQGRIISPEVASRVYEGIAQQADRQGKAGEGAQKLLDQLHEAAAGKIPKYKITTPTLDAHITHAQNAEFAAPSRSVAEVQAVVAATQSVGTPKVRVAASQSPVPPSPLGTTSLKEPTPSLPSPPSASAKPITSPPTAEQLATAQQPKVAVLTGQVAAEQAARQGPDPERPDPAIATKTERVAADDDLGREPAAAVKAQLDSLAAESDRLWLSKDGESMIQNPHIRDEEVSILQEIDGVRESIAATLKADPALTMETMLTVKDKHIGTVGEILEKCNQKLADLEEVIGVRQAMAQEPAAAPIVDQSMGSVVDAAESVKAVQASVASADLPQHTGAVKVAQAASVRAAEGAGAEEKAPARSPIDTGRAADGPKVSDMVANINAQSERQAVVNAAGAGAASEAMSKAATQVQSTKAATTGGPS